jgi:hypothetical protein
VKSGRSPRHYTRTDLFLVRIWTRPANAGIIDAAVAGGEDRGDAISMPEWQGTVQRAVDGEAHPFSSWQGLQDLLQAMLSNNKRRQEL